MAQGITSKNDLTWEVDNKLIPKFAPNDLKWYERDGLDTWYLQNKCNEFINNTDTYFKRMKITNFDLIKNDVPKEKLKQYQTLDHDEIKQYPPQLREQICSSILRNVIEKICTYKSMQLMNILIIKKFVLGVVDFSKRLETICMRSLEDFFVCIFNYLEKNQMLDNTHGYFLFFSSYNKLIWLII